MKNIFGAKAQTATFVKSISLLMLVFLVTFCVTSCKNETAPAVPQPTKYESVLDAKVSPTLPMETEKQLQELGTISEIDYKSLCIGGGTAGQERRKLTIGGNGAGSTMPRNLTDIGGNEAQVSRRLAVCGNESGQGKTIYIGGNQTGRRFADIGGNGAGSSVQRRLSDNGGNGVTTTMLSTNDNPKAKIDTMDIGGGFGGTVQRLHNSNSPGALLT